MDVRLDIVPDSPDGIHLRDVSVRLARPDERTRWDAPMDQYHYLGFKRFADVVCDMFSSGVASGWALPAGSQEPSSAALVTDGSAGSKNSCSPACT